MDSNKFINVVLTSAIIVFIVLGIISLKLNYEGIENQNKILEGQDTSLELHIGDRKNASKEMIDLLNEIREIVKG